MKLWVAWASGRHVRRSVKNSAILPAVVGVSSIFKRGTCSLSAVKEGKWGIQEMGAPGPFPASMCRDSQRPESHPTFPQMQPHWLSL